MSTIFVGISYSPVVSAKVPTADQLCQGTCPLVANPDEFAGNGDLRETITALLLTVAQFLTYIAVAVAIIFIIYGGYQWMNVNNPESAATGQKTVTNAAIGLAIAILAATVVSLLSSFLQGDVTGTGGGSFQDTSGELPQ